MRRDAGLRRHFGYGGERIVMHRAFRRLRVTPRILTDFFLLVPLLIALEWYAYPILVDFWDQSLKFWIVHMALPMRIHRLSSELAGVSFEQLALESSTTAITIGVWLAHAAFVFMAVVLTLKLPEPAMPLVYMVRIVCGLHAIALLFFLFFESSFPYSAVDHTRDLFGFRIFLLMGLPIVLGLTYFFFEVSWLKKLFACFLVLGYFVLSLPFLLLGHAVLLACWSPLAMPVLYLVFGPLLDILIFIAIYSWMVTWSEATPPLV